MNEDVPMIREVVGYLKVNVKTVYTHAQKHRMLCIKVGGSGAETETRGSRRGSRGDRQKVPLLRLTTANRVEMRHKPCGVVAPMPSGSRLLGTRRGKVRQVRATAPFGSATDIRLDDAVIGKSAVFPFPSAKSRRDRG